MSADVTSIATVLLALFALIAVTFSPFFIVDCFKWIVSDILPDNFRYGRMWSVINKFQNKKTKTSWFPKHFRKVPVVIKDMFSFYQDALTDIIYTYYYTEKDYIDLITLVIKYSSWANDSERKQIVKQIVSLRETVPSVKTAFYSFNEYEIEKLLSHDSFSSFVFLRALKRVKHPSDLNP